MSTWPNRGGPPAAPAGGSKRENPKTQAANLTIRSPGLTQANSPPRNPVWFNNLVEGREVKALYRFHAQVGTEPFTSKQSDHQTG